MYVCLCVCHITFLSGYIRSDTLRTTDIDHVLTTPCHVIEINYVDRGVAARTPLQFRCNALLVPAPSNDARARSSQFTSLETRYKLVGPVPCALLNASSYNNVVLAGLGEFGWAATPGNGARRALGKRLCVRPPLR